MFQKFVCTVYFLRSVELTCRDLTQHLYQSIILQCNVNSSTVQLYSVPGSSLLGGMCCSHLGGAVLPAGGNGQSCPEPLQADVLGGHPSLSALMFTALSSREGEMLPSTKGKGDSEINLKMRVI